MEEREKCVYQTEDEISKDAALLSLQMAFSMDLKEVKGLLYELLRKRLVGRKVRTLHYI